MPGLELYWEAYFELKNDRPIGMDFGPIPWSSIVRWAELNGLSDLHEITKLNRYIRSMEAVELEEKEKSK